MSKVVSQTSASLGRATSLRSWTLNSPSHHDHSAFTTPTLPSHQISSPFSLRLPTPLLSLFSLSIWFNLHCMVKNFNYFHQHLRITWCSTKMTLKNLTWANSIVSFLGASPGLPNTAGGSHVTKRGNPGHLISESPQCFLILSWFPVIPLQVLF